MRQLFILILLPILLVGQAIKPDLTVQVPMRDGTTLPTDLYFPPNGACENLPTVLLRSPAGREALDLPPFVALSQAGYLVVVQSTRNVEDPLGKTLPFLTDGFGKLQDGYDTLEWLSKTNYTNGKVATAGVSAMGITQLLLAPTAHPSLKFQYIGFAPASLYHHAIFKSGQVYKHQVESWLGYYAPDSGVHNFIVNQTFFNEFWEQLDSRSVASQVETPALMFAGWYDTFLEGSLDAFLARQNEGGRGARGKQKLVIGPWTHFWPHVLQFGDFEIPPIGNSPPVDLSPLPWLEYYLKGNKTGVDQVPAVTYFVMGPFDGTPSKGNVWKSSDVWPPQSSSFSLYLTKLGDLVPEEGLDEEGEVTFSYDPNDPVPTLGGNNLFLESGPKDQRPIEAREDVILFTSSLLKEDLEVTGQLLVNLHLSSDQDDTDIVIRLTDVYPDGRSILIADGIYRTGLDHCLGVIKPQEGCSITVDLGPMSMVFAKGHKIRLSVTGSNYPRFEKNLNIGIVGGECGGVSKANTTLHLGKESRLILPVVKS